MNSGDRSILVFWLLAIALITWRELKAPTGVLNGRNGTAGIPNPAAYTASIVVYGGAALIGEAAPGLGVALAAGWTLVIVYRMLNVKEGPPEGVTQP